jgi:hypothetical protein
MSHAQPFRTRAERDGSNESDGSVRQATRERVLIALQEVYRVVVVGLNDLIYVELPMVRLLVELVTAR